MAAARDDAFNGLTANLRVFARRTSHTGSMTLSSLTLAWRVAIVAGLTTRCLKINGLAKLEPAE